MTLLLMNTCPLVLLTCVKREYYNVCPQTPWDGNETRKANVPPPRLYGK